jgi:hypothetical protein
MTNTNNTNLFSLDYVSNPLNVAYYAAISLASMGYASAVGAIPGGYAVVSELGVAKFIDNRVN